MTTIDLVYDLDCPNVAAARANLLEAFARTGVPPSWAEHVIGDAAIPERVRGYGSPTLLIDGRDVAGVEPGSSTCCRVYAGAESNSGAPSVELIARALVGAVGA
jgi:hypothetical protein